MLCESCLLVYEISEIEAQNCFFSSVATILAHRVYPFLGTEISTWERGFYLDQILDGLKVLQARLHHGYGLRRCQIQYLLQDFLPA